ncbi:hypothetical protein MJO28_000142 [Puccinia striiformis f. sp. tritici]|uniref:Uncharacterized protein n=4 Tax=Puccinia striiformis TaxID=27350 RepID=A0A2S4URW1_9BASI|nr:hypothetical protein Pst134EA_001072 [Puccinia striiformis f. sp. tritici]KAI9624974.1 hypothetical protein H4Q26_016541 [Puccinia striiformis f. sp. tritici PST-130]KNF00319.1 hypothetical protein PSTG_06492 [Puccinia striiformis f. sp. tritici PST-78]POV93887.1 hypothetical protein PSHT_16561 [Puccinia striiformis]KAH9474019.1 hypothetical protein Pst134EA_001072 [Puccinia striiformis f. sp. tritici]KAI7962048.1 hypothetical protein MJO28_000142 [Puccinia striiformis f. sp. tritici]
MRWLPLESNPDVMNSWASALGLSTEEVSFTDVYGLDKELLEMVPKPVYAVLMLFPISKEYEQARSKENDLILAENNSQEILKNLNERVIFIKQTISNACGTIGLLHALANNPKIPIKEGSLTEFFKECKSKNAHERAELLEKNNGIASVHADQALSGQSKVPDSNEAVDLHFVCFVKSTGNDDKAEDRLIELDGRKSFPIDHGPIPRSDDLLDAVVPIVKKFIALSNDNLNFNLIALVQNSC